MITCPAFQDPYSLDFMGLEDTYGERDLEAAIPRKLPGEEPPIGLVMREKEP